MNLQYDGVQIVELRVTGIAGTGQTATTWSFGQQQFLQGKTIVGMDIYLEDAITNGPISGSTVITDANVKKASLVLQRDGVQVVQSLPLIRLNQVVASTDPYNRIPFTISPQQIDWQNSKVNFNAAPGNTSDVVIVFGVYWKY